MDAIIDNKGGMSVLSPLTDAQVKFIAEALSNCNKDEDDDDDEDEEERDHDKKEKDSKRRWGKRSHHDD